MENNKNKIEKLCIIEKSKIYFFDFYDGEYKHFGTIDPIGIQFNIFTKMNGNELEQYIPNPSIEFYIELGWKLKEVLKDNEIENE